MNHYSRKSEGSCILDNPRKNCQRGFLGKILSFFFFFLFFLSFPHEAKAMGCYQDGRYIGNLEVSHLRATYWMIVSNTTNQAYLEFELPEITSPIYLDEVYMKQGNDPSWTKVPYNGTPYFTKLFNVGNERCGYVWVSVRWKSRINEQNYYCNLKVTKYDKGPFIENFINQTCIYSTCRITNPLSKGAALRPDVVFPADGIGCYKYSLVLAGGGWFDQTFMFNYDSRDDTCSTFQYYDEEEYVPTEGTVRAFISPSDLSTVFTTATGNLQLYNYINETSCGNPVTPTPTPTPVVKNICSKVTGYVKNKTTGKGIQGAKVTAHGIDNSTGNCQGKHYGCSVATTNAFGHFEINCNNVADINTKCLGVYETRNATGYTDAYGAYGPAGSQVWNNNTIVLNNPQTSICGSFNFFDKK